MLSSVASFLGTRQPERIVVDGVRLGLVESYLKYFNNGASIDKCSLAQVMEMKKHSLMSGLKEDHDLIKKFDQRIKSFANTKLTPPKRDFSLAETSTLNSSSVFDQKDMKPEQMGKILEKEGSKFTQLILREVSDDLIELLPKFCPQLKELCIHQREDQPLFKEFTDKSFEAIGQLKNLTKLDLDIWNSMFDTAEGLNALLSQPQLKANLTELSIKIAYRVNDTTLSTISEYKTLKSFSLTTVGVTTAGLEYLVNSKTLKASIEKLKIDLSHGFQNLAISNYVISGITQMKGLKNLSLAGPWTAIDSYILPMFQNLTQLISFKMSGYAFTKDFAAKLTPTVENLEIADCSSLASNDFDLLTGRTALKKLNLAKCTNFLDNHMGGITLLPKIEELSIDGAVNVWKGVDTLTQSEAMQKQLKALSLSNFPQVPTKSWGNLRLLQSLKSLEVKDCTLFNDTSLKMLIVAKETLNITALALEGVSISSAYMGSFGRFAKLTTLMIARCNSVTKQGTDALFSSVSLQKRLRKIYTDGLVVSKETIEKLKFFKRLEVLFLDNAWTGYGQKKQKLFFEITHPLYKENKHVSLGFGESFLNLKGLKEIK